MFNDMKFSVVFYSTILLSLIISGCSSEKISPNELNDSENYFPVLEGTVSFFKIENTTFNIFGTELESFILKEKIENLDTGYAFVSVSKYDSSSQTFVIESNYSIDIRTDKYITNKGSLRKVEAIFPFINGTSFNENQFNNQESSLLTIDSINATFNIEGEEIKNALKVSIPDVKNNIQNNQFYRIYKKNEGLSYEINQEIETQPGQTPIGFKNTKKRIKL